jgi:hypothetical protein
MLFSPLQVEINVPLSATTISYAQEFIFLLCWHRRGGQSAQLAQELNMSLQNLVVF